MPCHLAWRCSTEPLQERCTRRLSASLGKRIEKLSQSIRTQQNPSLNRLRDGIGYEREILPRFDEVRDRPFDGHGRHAVDEHGVFGLQRADPDSDPVDPRGPSSGGDELGCSREPVADLVQRRCRPPRYDQGCRAAESEPVNSDGVDLEHGSRCAGHPINALRETLEGTGSRQARERLAGDANLVSLRCRNHAPALRGDRAELCDGGTGHTAFVPEKRNKRSN